MAPELRSVQLLYFSTAQVLWHSQVHYELVQKKVHGSFCGLSRGKVPSRPKLGEHGDKHKSLNKDSWFSNQNSNPESPEYKPVVIPWLSIFPCKVVAHSTQRAGNGKQTVFKCQTKKALNPEVAGHSTISALLLKLLGAFANSLKAPTSFVTSVHPFVRNVSALLALDECP